MLDPDQPYTKNQSVERTYRSFSANDLLKFRVVIGESDLWVLTNHDIQLELVQELKFYRRQLKEYIHCYPLFATSLDPYPEDPAAPEIVQWMINATAKAGVGPMASVAGAVAGMLGKKFAENCSELIIENGGDIYLQSTIERIISIYAGNSVLSMRVGLKIPPQSKGLGVCTSAGTVGPSLSFGKADAVVIISTDVALADASATATANSIKTTSDLTNALALARTIPGVQGVLVIKDDQMAAWGDIQLVPLGEL